MLLCYLCQQSVIDISIKYWSSAAPSTGCTQRLIPVLTETTPECTWYCTMGGLWNSASASFTSLNSGSNKCRIRYFKKCHRVNLGLMKNTWLYEHWPKLNFLSTNQIHAQFHFCQPCSLLSLHIVTGKHYLIILTLGEIYALDISYWYRGVCVDWLYSVCNKC